MTSTNVDSNSMPDLARSAAPAPRAGILAAVMLTLLIGAGIAPTLGWQEFSSSMENLNVTTAMEIRRTGNWLVPTLQGQTRLQKPPLPAWLTAAVIGPQTMRDLSSPNTAVRDKGFVRLAWRVRGLSLAVSCLTLLLVFFMGQMLAGTVVGLVSLAVMGTTLLFMAVSRYSTTDVWLMLWVTATNLLLITAMFQRRFWFGFGGAGVALALAMLSKGPVALLQSVAPVAAFWAMLRLRCSELLKPLTKKQVLTPMIAALGFFVVLGLTWYFIILVRVPNAISIWKEELAGYKEVDTRRKPVYQYLALLPHLAPWSVFFIVGLVTAFRRMADRDVLLLLLLLLPIVVMSFFPDRYERYLLPMLPAAAIMTASAVVDLLRTQSWTGSEKTVNFLHWITLGTIGVGFPIAAAGVIRQIQRLDGTPWFSPLVGWGAAGIALFLIGIFASAQRRRPWILVLGTLAIMLGMQNLYMAGYSQTREGRADFRPLAQRIWEACPDAEVFNLYPQSKRPPTEVGLYLNRIVRWIPEASRLEPAVGHPIVLLVPIDPDHPDLAPALPSGYIPLAQKLTKGEGWAAYVLPARPQSEPPH